MEMQPMSAHNRELVCGIARRFKLRVQVSGDPSAEGAAAAAPHPDDMKAVLLLKTTETCL